MQPRTGRWLPVLALVAFGLILLTPLFRWQAFCADDLLPHIHKAYALERLMSEGHWLPRWSPDLARGYGYPLFNFYAPLSSYPLVALHWIGLPYSAAIQVLMSLALLLAGIAMFAFVRDLFGEWAGFAAGVAYMAAPYLGYDIFYRGALAEVFGWIWLPLILWGIYRATRAASWQWAAVAALCYAALLPSHNVLALISTPLFIGWCVVVALGAGDWKRVRFGGLALALGLMVAACFWLPALLERNFVRIDRLLDPPLLQYNTNFISLNELLPLSWNFDPLLANPSPPRALGLLFAFFALPTLFTLLNLRSFNKRPEQAGVVPAVVEGRVPTQLYTIAIIYLTLALLAYALMTLDLSQPIWDAIPLLSFVQFPWRMLAPASACAAVLVGAGVGIWGGLDTNGNERRAALLSIGFSVPLILAHLSWFTPLNCGPLLADTPETLRQLRAETFQEGAYDYSEYLPATVQTFPADDSVYNTLIAGEHPDRLFAEGIATAIADDPLNATYTLNAASEQQAIYRQFWYPGWQVELDGEPQPVEPNPEGLITFTLPSGQHRLHIYFGETPLRSTADILSLIGLLACAALGALGLRQAPTNAPDESRPIVPDAQQSGSLPASPRLLLSVAIAASILLALFRFFIIETPDSFRRTAFNGEQVLGSTPLRASFAGGVELYGYTLPDNAQSGSSVDVIVYAGVRQSVENRYVPSISIEDDQGLLWNDPQIDFPRWLRPPYTADAWQVGQYAQWARRVTILPGTPPGQYHVWATVYDADTLAPDSVIDSSGSPIAPRVDLGFVTVTRPIWPAAPDALDMQVTVNTPRSESITLLGYSLDRMEARPGDTIFITAFWQANSRPDSNLRTLIRFIDEQGNVVYSRDFRNLGGMFPTSQWKAGDVWRTQYLIRLPATLEDGNYNFRIGLGGGVSLTTTAGAIIGTIHVAAPPRVLVEPPIQRPVNAQLGSFAELVGYSINGAARPGEPVTITLIWRGLSTPEANYSAFIHLSDSEGRVWAQSDGIPVNWTRPTTGWLPDEYIVDERVITLPADLPAGDYTIFVGMADVLTGERAPVSGVGATEDNRIQMGLLKVDN